MRPAWRELIEDAPREASPVIRQALEVYQTATIRRIMDRRVDAARFEVLEASTFNGQTLDQLFRYAISRDLVSAAGTARLCRLWLVLAQAGEERAGRRGLVQEVDRDLVSVLERALDG